MHLFYQPELKNGLLELSQDETRHATKVLRLGVGDQVEVTDGKGTRATVEFTEVSKRSCLFQVVEEKTEPRPILPKVAIAPTKSIDRFEWFLEKAVEIGVSEICPILCSNSERKIIKQERSEKVLLAAMKQSQRNWLPKLQPLTSYSDFIAQANEPLLIAHCRDGKKSGLTNSLETESWILIGPEGDFSVLEIQMAMDKGATEIELGKSRLRTETAGIFALSTMNFLKG